MLPREPGTDALTARSSRVVAARKLQRRRGRDKAERFLAEGPQAVREAVAAGAVEDLFYDLDADARHSDLIDAAVAAGAHVHPCTDDALASLAETVTPQGLVAVCHFLEKHGLDQRVPFAEAKLVAVLHGITDPGNAGTVLRAADAAGADCVVFGTDSVDPYNGKCVRASAGSLFHLPVVRAADTADMLDLFVHAQILAAAADGEDLYALDAAGELDAPTVWLFGSEAHGLDDATAALAHRRVGVPIWGKAESLNLAVAAGVCLYASAAAQRRAS
ncbi:TrmH family RNA methyltransferase [Glycomyces albidus]|jgi:TrmH family RNA methyltransferase|uniref:RNA methyltransferase n=1 Tax=Glycomyces albidus TaxID=2656774 RepID=A0A6L5G4I4_9ACTN|nr:RNA methyltransferase [Glycomyces albidus]MQM24556.1 RNA methyltransferase [Glycomyces albidus]